MIGCDSDGDSESIFRDSTLLRFDSCSTSHCGVSGDSRPAILGIVHFAICDSMPLSFGQAFEVLAKQAFARSGRLSQLQVLGYSDAPAQSQVKSLFLLFSRFLVFPRFSSFQEAEENLASVAIFAATYRGAEKGAEWVTAIQPKNSRKNNRNTRKHLF